MYNSLGSNLVFFLTQRKIKNILKKIFKKFMIGKNQTKNPNQPTNLCYDKQQSRVSKEEFS